MKPKATRKAFSGNSTPKPDQHRGAINKALHVQHSPNNGIKSAPDAKKQTPLKPDVANW